ncbi:MAG: SRPBCC domain-containing protein [Solirubrobacterales bacterium]
MDERRVERETILEAEPERVWEALTDDDLLSDWFADRARIEPYEGGEVEFDCEDGERRGTVRRVEEERELEFSWSRDGNRESLVTFTLEPVEFGTRLVVVEQSLDAPVAIAAWSPRLRALELCLGSLVLA